MSIPDFLLVKDIINVIETDDQITAGSRNYYFYGNLSSKEENQVPNSVPFYAVALLTTGELVYFRWRSEGKYGSYNGEPLLGRGIYHHCEKLNG